MTVAQNGSVPLRLPIIRPVVVGAEEIAYSEHSCSAGSQWRLLRDGAAHRARPDNRRLTPSTTRR
jgi:hypothetical protein